jgi:DNA-binding response OmpR family regulator
VSASRPPRQPELPAPEVTLVRWPDEAERAARVAGASGAVLYLVGDDDDPPLLTSCLADWVRLPSGKRDLDARVAVLARRARDHHQPPFVDDEGYLHYLGSLVSLSPAEARLAAALTATFGEVVPDHALVEGGAISTSEAARVLRGRMAHLRAQLRPVGLSVHRVRGRGYRVEGH